MLSVPNVKSDIIATPDSSPLNPASILVKLEKVVTPKGIRNERIVDTKLEISITGKYKLPFPLYANTNGRLAITIKKGLYLCFKPTISSYTPTNPTNIINKLPATEIGVILLFSNRATKRAHSKPNKTAIPPISGIIGFEDL